MNSAPRQGCQPTHNMPSTHTCLLYHLNFATKNRERVLRKEWQPRLHEYLGGIVNGLGGVAQGVGGVEDHVHLLVGLKPTHCLSDFVRELKKSSSTWITDAFAFRDFNWQEGYAAFTVSASARASVQNYIADQAEHHRHKSFRDELIEFLNKSEVEYDEAYLD